MLDNFKEASLIYCYWVGDYLKRVLVIVSVSGFAISIAVSFYGAFYYAILPSTAISLPVKFSFNSCAVVGQPCSFITSTVRLKDKQLLPGLRYNLELMLELPDTSPNREVGMFLSCTTFISSTPSRSQGSLEQQAEVSSQENSCVSAVVPFKPLLVSYVESLLLLPLILTRLVTASTNVGINLVDDHEENVMVPSTGIRVELQTSRLQIHSGVLKVWTNDLAGIRYLMYHHPLVSMILGVASILTVTCLLGALALSRFLSPHRVVQAGVGHKIGPRSKSNHDLADRQARARLSLDYRQEMARRQLLHQSEESSRRKLSLSSNPSSSASLSRVLLEEPSVEVATLGDTRSTFQLGDGVAQTTDIDNNVVRDNMVVGENTVVRDSNEVRDEANNVLEAGREHQKLE